MRILHFCLSLLSHRAALLLPLRFIIRHLMSAVTDQPWHFDRANPKATEKQHQAIVPRPLREREELSFLFSFWRLVNRWWESAFYFGNFGSQTYWSSSEDNNGAFVHDFQNGNRFPASKDLTYNVRAVRAISPPLSGVSQLSIELF
jgi:hypothetical protein